ncbi:MAG: stalk domain-containing protein [Oscillospiraceae bacterium]
MKKQNRIISILLSLTLVASLALPATAALIRRTIEVDGGLKVYSEDSAVKTVDANGKAVDVFASEGTTYLPVRAVGDALGQNVGWDSTTNTVYLSENTADAKDADYLNTYFKIEPFKGEVTRSVFDAALEKLGGTKTAGTGALTVAEAVKSAIAVAGMNELALTCTAKKADERLAAYGIAGVPAADAPFVATALDCALASSTWSFNAKLDAATATTLLMNAAEIAGKGRNYLGNSSDADIYAKLQAAWASFGLFDDAKLSKLGVDLVIAGASTGYNLKYDGYNAKFLPEYTLQYGHSDITHAAQLIALLNSENIDAKVALEPKTSIYEYMVEWGDPKGVPQTPTYALKPIDGGRWLCYATEYDMKLEFNTVAEKEAFDAVIAAYAKKWDTNTDKDGNPTAPLLAGAWWQPLYSSTVPMKDSKNFVQIKDNVVRNGAYSIHPFSTVDGTAAIAKVVSAKTPDLKVELTDLYVNLAFHHYLTGTDHQ